LAWMTWPGLVISAAGEPQVCEEVLADELGVAAVPVIGVPGCPLAALVSVVSRCSSTIGGPDAADG